MTINITVVALQILLSSQPVFNNVCFYNSHSMNTPLSVTLIVRIIDLQVLYKGHIRILN